MNVGRKPNDWHPYKKRRGLLCGEGRRTGGLPTSRGIARIAGHTGSWEKAWKDSSLKPSEGTRLCQLLEFRAVASRTVRKYVAVVVSQFRGTLL